MPVHAAAPLRLVHVGLHDSLNANAGDTLLFQALRDLVEHVAGPVEWTLRQLWDPLEPDEARALSGDHDGVLVGGGGLLLRDQQGSDTSRSGWQWNVSPEAIAAIDVPLAVTAIGYNRFRGQPEFDAPFRDSLRSLARHACFLGLRNSGSVRAVAGYLPDGLGDRLRVLSCPTTGLLQIYGLPHTPSPARPLVGVNVAFDRPGHRFGDDEDGILRSVADACRTLQDGGAAIELLLHKTLDAQARPWLDAAGVRYTTTDLTGASPAEVIAAYRPLSVAVGMRGHSQLVPFGLGVPIVSLVTHDKLAWFLEDLERPSWGIEMTGPDLATRIAAATRDALTEARRDDVRSLQLGVWNATVAAVEDLVRLLTDARAHAAAA